MKKVLITGASGLLGSHLSKYFLGENYAVIGTHGSKELNAGLFKTKKLDLRETSSIKEFIASEMPDIVIHSAAATDIDWCEKNSSECDGVNFEATKSIVDACKSSNLKLVYVSTPSVFGSNDISKKLKVDDDLTPRSFYAKTKKRSEEIVLAYKNSSVVRLTPFGHSPSSNHLTDWAITSSGKGHEIFGYTDSLFNPIFAGNVGIFLEKIILENLTGLFHLGCKNQISKFDFIDRILKLQKIDYSISPAAMSDHNKARNAYRNSNNALCLVSTERLLGIKFKKFDSELRDFMNYKDSGNYQNISLVYE